MAEVVAIAFDKSDEADRVLTELSRLEQAHLVDLWDAVIAVREPDGTVRLRQNISLGQVGAASGGLSGAIWGAAVGFFFLNPIAGVAVGTLLGAGGGALVSAGSAALTGWLIDHGIEKFIRSMAENIPPDSSALFVLVRKAQPEKVLAELAPFRGRVLRSSLSPEQEARLQTAISEKKVVPQLAE